MKIDNSTSGVVSDIKKDQSSSSDVEKSPRLGESGPEAIQNTDLNVSTTDDNIRTSKNRKGLVNKDVLVRRLDYILSNIDHNQSTMIKFKNSMEKQLTEYKATSYYAIDGKALDAIFTTLDNFPGIIRKLYLEINDIKSKLYEKVEMNDLKVIESRINLIEELMYLTVRFSNNLNVLLNEFIRVRKGYRYTDQIFADLRETYIATLGWLQNYKKEFKYVTVKYTGLDIGELINKFNDFADHSIYFKKRQHMFTFLSFILLITTVVTNIDTALANEHADGMFGGNKSKRNNNRSRVMMSLMKPIAIPSNNSSVITRKVYPLSGGAGHRDIQSIISYVMQLARRPEIRAHYVSESFTTNDNKLSFYCKSASRAQKARVLERLNALEFWLRPSFTAKRNNTSLSDSLLATCVLSKKRYFIFDSISDMMGDSAIKIKKQVRYKYYKESNKVVNKINSDFYDSLGDFEKFQSNLRSNDIDPEISRYLFKSVIKRHSIKLNASSFSYSPMCDLVLQYFFSPQKDIYNVTYIAVRDYRNTEHHLYSPFINFIPVKNSDIYEFNYNMLVKLQCLVGKSKNYYGKNHLQMRMRTDAKPASNKMYKFVEKLIHSNIDNLINIDSGLKFNNLGFDIGSDTNLNRAMGGGSTKNVITGGGNGYIINDMFCHKFINVGRIISSNNELELLSSAYNINESDSDNNFCEGKLLYASLFKSDFGEDNSILSYKHMFTLILNYFHKFNVSFTSMFDQLCFPSILFNASTLRLFIDRMSRMASNAMSSYIIENAPRREGEMENTSFKRKLLTVIMLYLKSFATGGNVLDNTLTYIYQIKFSDRLSIVSIDRALTNIRDATDAPSFDNNASLWIANQYASISVANSFFYELIRYVDLHGLRTDANENNKLYDKNRDVISALFSSNLCGSIRHLDAITTYASIIFMLLKQTTYYDHENDAEVTFFNNTDMEPFSVT